jgi:hypothetical protein
LHRTCKKKKKSHTEGLNAIKTALRYVEQQEDTTPVNLLLLRRLRNIPAKRGTAIKQDCQTFCYESLK